MNCSTAQAGRGRFAHRVQLTTSGGAWTGHTNEVLSSKYWNKYIVIKRLFCALEQMNLNDLDHRRAEFSSYWIQFQKNIFWKWAFYFFICFWEFERMNFNRLLNYTAEFSNFVTLFQKISLENSHLIRNRQNSFHFFVICFWELDQMNLNILLNHTDHSQE